MSTAKNPTARPQLPQSFLPPPVLKESSRDDHDFASDQEDAQQTVISAMASSLSPSFGYPAAVIPSSLASGHFNPATGKAIETQVSDPKSPTHSLRK